MASLWCARCARWGRNVKVIVSSGHLLPDQTVTLEKLGVKHFLDKPYTAAKLLRTLRTALDEQPAAPKAD